MAASVCAGAVKGLLLWFEKITLALRGIEERGVWAAVHAEATNTVVPRLH